MLARCLKGQVLTRMVIGSLSLHQLFDAFHPGLLPALMLGKRQATHATLIRT